MTGKDIAPDGMDVVWLVTQQMLNDAHFTAQSLIDDGEEYRNRYRVLAAAVLDLADTVDSRKMAARLEYLAHQVAGLSRDEVATVAESINTNVWERDRPRLPYGVHAH